MGQSRGRARQDGAGQDRAGRGEARFEKGARAREKARARQEGGHAHTYARAFDIHLHTPRDVMTPIRTCTEGEEGAGEGGSERGRGRGRKGEREREREKGREGDVRKGRW